MRVLVVASIALGGCIVYAAPPSSPHSARVLASNDLGCPYDAIDVVPIGGEEFLAFGCGRRETFACIAQPASDDMRCDRVVGRNDYTPVVQASYALPAPTCYAACSATSSATCRAACNAP